ncbi:MAG TPA: hypothetical protein VGX94_09595 [Terriglobia bacterium]|nr:hypothetical protein [Terriglobia bacterium]
MPKFTKPIGLKFADADFRTIQARAFQDGKRLGEWCRDKILEAIQPRGARPGEYAIMAEITATQSIVIDLLCALGRDGKLTQQKAQAVVDAAHSTKYKEAAELLKYAYTQFQSGHLETGSDQATGSKR